MTPRTCTTCARPLNPGDTAWATDAKAIDLATGEVRWVTRYTCDPCVTTEEVAS